MTPEEKIQLLKHFSEQVKEATTASESDLLEEVLKMSKDPDGRKELIALAEKLKAEFYPLVTLVVEVMGDDIDKVTDKLIEWGAKKSWVAYKAYKNAGFGEDEAFALVCRTQLDLKSVMNR